MHYIIFLTLHRKNSIWNFKLCLPACEYNDFLCSKQLDSQRFSLWFSQVASGSWDIEGQQIFLVLRRATQLFNIQLLHHTFMLIHNGSLPALEHLPWGLDCNWFCHPFLEIFLVRVSLTLSFRCGGDKKRKIKKSSSAACCCTENAFPLISQTSNRALPLPVNPFHHRPPQKDRSFCKTFARVMLTSCSSVPTVVSEADGIKVDLKLGNCLLLIFGCVRTFVKPGSQLSADGTFMTPSTSGWMSSQTCNCLTMLKKQPNSNRRETRQDRPGGTLKLTSHNLDLAALIWVLRRVGGVWAGAGPRSKKEVV